MKFGPVPLEQAGGAILAHSVPLKKGRLRKGLVLEPAHIEQLRGAGLSAVTVARLEPGDMGENEAAARLAAALVPDPAAVGLRLGPAATGRVNVFAEGPGVARIDADRIHAVNGHDPMVTVATVPCWQRMDAGGMVATVKIISYAVPGAAVEAACAAGAGALSLARPVYGHAHLVQTAVAGEDGEKGQRALRQRLDRLGLTLGRKTMVPHRVPELAAALTAAADGGAEALFILTGSATSDMRDVAPEAVRAAGGDVAVFGMPVDPGNLLFLGSLGARPVIGLPGCARSPALNGADWVMERVLCGIELSPADIAAMGVGGLLKEIPSRPRPRQAHEKAEAGG